MTRGKRHSEAGLEGSSLPGPDRSGWLVIPSRLGALGHRNSTDIDDSRVSTKWVHQTRDTIIKGLGRTRELRGGKDAVS